MYKIESIQLLCLAGRDKIQQNNIRHGFFNQPQQRFYNISRNQNHVKTFMWKF